MFKMINYIYFFRLLNKPVINMDEVDHKIISQLQRNGRTTFKTLGELTGYTSMGVKKRVDKLLKEGIINISAQLNLEKLNLCAAVVLIETDGPEYANKLIKCFEECPRVVYIFKTIGGYNIIALVVAENQETLESIAMEKCSLKSKEGIRRSEFYPIRDIHYSPFMPVRRYLAKKNLPTPPCNVDCETCERYISNECVGCSAAKYYRGSL